MIVEATPTQPAYTGERTLRQTAVSFGGFAVAKLPASYDTYRRMRKNPTIALARALSVAPIVAGEWSVEADDDVPDEADKFIQKQFLPIREPFMERVLYGGCDFGHQPFEKIFENDGRAVTLRKLKPLLHDITQILADKQTGAFRGFRQGEVDVPLENALLIPFRVEGTNWHGEPLLENAREIWNQWNEANAGAARYDRKVAGSHFVVEFPPGTSVDQNGNEMDNATRAQEILQALESSGCVAMLRDMAPFADKFAIDNPGWKISILEDGGGRQPTFVDRLNYLDSQMARALLMPERAILQGQHGTLAEAGAHIDLALTNCELTHRHVTRLINWYAVDQLLAINYGEAARGKVRLVASPLVDTKLEYLKQVYAGFLANPSGFLEEYAQIDTDALKDTLGIPKAAEVAQAGDEPALEGVDTDSPAGAAVRRLYSDLATPADQPIPAPPTTQAGAAAQGEVQATALNGAQIASIVDICARVGEGTLTREAAGKLIKISFPLIAESQIAGLVSSLNVSATPPQPPTQ